MNNQIDASAGNREEASRQKILDCARELYIEFGLRRTTMDDVAKRAGMGRATLYRRFSDKDQLFQAVIFRDVQQDIAKIEAAISRSPNYLEGLLDAFVMAVLLINRSPLLSRLLVTEPDLVLPFLSIQFESSMTFGRQFMAERIAHGQQAKHIKQLPPDMTAEMILRLVQSLMLSPNGTISATDEASVRAFADTLLRPLLQPC